MAVYVPTQNLLYGHDVEVVAYSVAEAFQKEPAGARLAAALRARDFSDNVARVLNSGTYELIYDLPLSAILMLIEAYRFPSKYRVSSEPGVKQQYDNVVNRIGALYESGPDRFKKLFGESSFLKFDASKFDQYASQARPDQLRAVQMAVTRNTLVIKDMAASGQGGNSKKYKDALATFVDTVATLLNTCVINAESPELVVDTNTLDVEVKQTAIRTSLSELAKVIKGIMDERKKYQLETTSLLSNRRTFAAAIAANLNTCAQAAKVQSLVVDSKQEPPQMQQACLNSSSGLEPVIAQLVAEVARANKAVQEANYARQQFLEKLAPKITTCHQAAQSSWSVAAAKTFEEVQTNCTDALDRLISSIEANGGQQCPNPAAHTQPTCPDPSHHAFHPCPSPVEHGHTCNRSCPSGSLTHDHGVWSSEAPARPSDFEDRHKQVWGDVRTYCTYVFKALRTDAPAEYITRLLQRLTKHAACSLSAYVPEVILPDSQFRRAVLTASFTKELFRVFSERPSKPASSIQDAIAQFRNVTKIVEPVATAFRDKDQEFAEWAQSVIARLKPIWTEHDHEWNMYFENNTNVGLQFWEVARNVWALHAMTRAYTVKVNMYGFSHGRALNNTLCTSQINVDADMDPAAREGLEVFCMTIPGFEIDGSIIRCDVVWREDKPAKQ